MVTVHFSYTDASYTIAIYKTVKHGPLAQLIQACRRVQWSKEDASEAKTEHCLQVYKTLTASIFPVSLTALWREREKMTAT